MNISRMTVLEYCIYRWATYLRCSQVVALGTSWKQVPVVAVAVAVVHERLAGAEQAGQFVGPGRVEPAGRLVALAA